MTISITSFADIIEKCNNKCKLWPFPEFILCLTGSNSIHFRHALWQFSIQYVDSLYILSLSLSQMVMILTNYDGFHNSDLLCIKFTGKCTNYLFTHYLFQKKQIKVSVFQSTSRPWLIVILQYDYSVKDLFLLSGRITYSFVYILDLIT